MCHLVVYASKVCSRTTFRHFHAFKAFWHQCDDWLFSEDDDMLCPMNARMITPFILLSPDTVEIEDCEPCERLQNSEKYAYRAQKITALQGLLAQYGERGAEDKDALQLKSKIDLLIYKQTQLARRYYAVDTSSFLRRVWADCEAWGVIEHGPITNQEAKAMRCLEPRHTPQPEQKYTYALRFEDTPQETVALYLERTFSSTGTLAYQREKTARRMIELQVSSEVRSMMNALDAHFGHLWLTFGSYRYNYESVLDWKDPSCIGADLFVALEDMLPRGAPLVGRAAETEADLAVGEVDDGSINLTRFVPSALLGIDSHGNPYDAPVHPVNTARHDQSQAGVGEVEYGEHEYDKPIENYDDEDVEPRRFYDVSESGTSSVYDDSAYYDPSAYASLVTSRAIADDDDLTDTERTYRERRRAR